MLKVKINNRNLRVVYQDVQTEGVLLSGDSIVIISKSKNFNSTVGDLIYFYRNDGSKISYEDESHITDIVSSDSSLMIACNAFKNVRLTVNSVEKTEDGKLLLKFNEEHFLNSNRDNVNVELYYDFLPENLSNIEVCENEYIVVQKYYLLKRVESDFECVNSVGTLYFSFNGGNGQAEAIVPCTFGGDDYEKSLIIDYNDSIYRNYENYSFYVKDERFFTYVEQALELKPGAEIRNRYGDPEINFKIESDFSPSILSDDSVSKFLSEHSGEKVNATLDYEKQQFVPISCYCDVPELKSGTTEVKETRFNLHFRVKDENWDTINNESGNYWHDDSSHSYGDSVISGMGFTYDDIYYQRKCVSESFLRISFYDKPDRTTQKLLYTAKLYLDANRLWNDYVKMKSGSATYTSENNILKANFVCTNKYDYDNPSEGFYIHLFPGNLNDEPGIWKAIYMRVEFNNAKYGKTTVFTLPYMLFNQTFIGEEYGQSMYVTNSAANTFTYTDSNGKLDNEKLKNDIYTLIYIRYNQKGKRYEWCPVRNCPGSPSDIMVFNLFEPLIVKYS